MAKHVQSYILTTISSMYKGTVILGPCLNAGFMPAQNPAQGTQNQNAGSRVNALGLYIQSLELF